MVGSLPAIVYTVSYLVGIPFTLYFLNESKASELDKDKSLLYLILTSVPFAIISVIVLIGSLVLLAMLPATYREESRNMREFWKVMLTWTTFLIPGFSFIFMEGMQFGAALTHYLHVTDTLSV